MGNEGVWKVTGSIYHIQSTSGIASDEKHSFLVLACNYKEAVENATKKLSERGIGFSQLTGVELLGELL